jgi:hypothetical protein
MPNSCFYEQPQMSAVRLCREEGVKDIYFPAGLLAKRGNTAPCGDGEMSCEARNLSDGCGLAQLINYAIASSRRGERKWTVIGKT